MFKTTYISNSQLATEIVVVDHKSMESTVEEVRKEGATFKTV